MELSAFNRSETANHMRWCKINGKVTIDWNKACELYNEGCSYIEIVDILKVPLSVFTRNAPKFLKVRTKSLAQKNARKRGKGNTKHSLETIAKIRKSALNSPHRRLKKKIYCYKGAVLDSKWELNLAKILDEMQIKWVRPSPLKWIDKNGTTHNYFPDFYLPDLNVYLDPKNDYAKKVQKEKLTTLLEQYRNIIIMGLSDINKDFISNLRPCIGTVF